METREPKIGDLIYVPTSLYVYRGADDFIGGLATISDIKYNDFLEKDHYNYTMIAIEERKGHYYNWNYLLDEQESLKERFGEQIAYADPDDRPEFNDDEADWH